MKVLHVYRTCYPVTNGGIEQVIRYLSRGVIERGGEARVVSLDSAPSFMSVEGVDIYLYKRDFSIASNCFSVGMYRNIKEHIEWADIIHLHYPWPSGDLLMFFCSTKAIVVTYHSDIERQTFYKKLYFPLETAFLSRADAIVATSPNYVETSDNLKKYFNKVRVVPLGVDGNDYNSTLESDSYVIDQYGRDYFLFVGVLRYYKGLEYLLRAAKNFKGKVVVAGNGPERDNLLRIIEDNNIPNVDLIGYVEDDVKASLLKFCKGIVFPSHVRSEAFGISLVEGLMFGKPLISCEIGSGTSFVNKDRETGFVIEKQSEEAIFNAMNKIFSDEDLAGEFGINSRRRFEQLFSSASMIDGYFDVYRDVLNS